MAFFTPALTSPAHRPLASLSAWIERQNTLGLALGVTAVHSVLYILPNHVQLIEPRALPLTSFERVVPFLPWTLWVYWSDYLLVYFAVRGFRRPGSTARFVYALLTVIAVATLVHWAFPTVFPREEYPVPADTSPLMAALIELFRKIDAPASCLPSLHVAASFVAVFAIHSEGEDRRRARLTLAWAVAVALSTLTTKQHYLLDVIAGAALAALVWRPFSRWRPHQSSQRSSRSARPGI